MAEPSGHWLTLPADMWTASGFDDTYGYRRVFESSLSLRFRTPTRPDVLPGTFDPTFITTLLTGAARIGLETPFLRRDLDDPAIVARKRRIRLPIAVRGTCCRLLRHSGEASLCSVVSGHFQVGRSWTGWCPSGPPAPLGTDLLAGEP